MTLNRRSFLRLGAVTAGAATAFGPTFWQTAFAAPVVPGAGPYGPLLAPDANGMRLPAGFSSRVVARSGVAPVAGATAWHSAPDGGATYATPDGGWVYVSNAEVTPGGAGALRFAPDGTVVDSYRILSGTRNNCAGGLTPWGTWLSCEETTGGLVYECNPFAPGQGIAKPALGAFAHEAVAVDPVGKRLYETEDSGSGRVYRFTPASYPDLTAGALEAAFATYDAGSTTEGVMSWVPVTNLTTGYRGADSTAFPGNEGIWYDSGFVYFTTKTNPQRVISVNCATNRFEVIYNNQSTTAPGVLSGLDNIMVSPFSGDLFVAEDGGTMDLVIIASGTREMTQFMNLTGQSGSEITGPALSPDGTRLYFSSQRGPAGNSANGLTYEVTGPFRTTRDLPAPVVPEVPLAVALPVIGAVAVAAGVAIAQRSGSAKPSGI